MRYLLDTHILLWWLNDDKKLKSTVSKVIQDKKNQIFISVVSGIEISIKNRSGKLPLKTTVKQIFKIAGFEVLDINLSHLLEFDKLSGYHKDPFDRILVSQAKVENLVLITSDEKIWKYDVHTHIYKA